MTVTVTWYCEGRAVEDRRRCRRLRHVRRLEVAVADVPALRDQLRARVFRKRARCWRCRHAIVVAVEERGR